MKWIDIRDRVRMNAEEFPKSKSVFWTYLDKRTQLRSIHDTLDHLISITSRKKNK